TLTQQEYQLFIQKHLVHYTQSIQHYNYTQKHKKHLHFLPLKHNHQLIPPSLLSQPQLLKIFKYFYSHTPPLLHFNNQKLLQS
ncbi:peptidoglycan bridge formation glycyltransferase FemA/FemB family protein, partial [Staphylococcus epidermidis]|uniref:peptidoglycan bridge formation glycyltransferase FemA/FemB family protein n=1 Tax=Staphylococcus epidermidis TaxID=1282 RepID=UPI0011A603D1